MALQRLFATGWNGLILSLAVIMFSFGGLELIGITAAEAQDPQKSIPKAVNQVVYRILLFYIGSLVVLLALYPWVEVKSNSSPFVMIFHNLDSNVVASALNFVIWWLRCRCITVASTLTVVCYLVSRFRGTRRSS